MELTLLINIVPPKGQISKTGKFSTQEWLVGIMIIPERLHGGDNRAPHRCRTTAGPRIRRCLASGLTRHRRVHSSLIRTVRRPVGVVTVRLDAREGDEPGSRTALRPTSNGSRCITKREVHAVHGRERANNVRHGTPREGADIFTIVIYFR
ncbi:hypothetical protein ACJJTC_015285 [Scirpophaga incertulas]